MTFDTCVDCQSRIRNFLGGNCFKSKQMDDCEYHGSLNHCLGFDPRLDYNYTESRVGSVVSS